MVGQVLPGTRRRVVHAVDGAQPVFLPVSAELAADGIKYPVTKAYQPAGRLAHLRHHQLEGVQNAVDTRSGERCAHLLEQCGDLSAQLPVRQHLPGATRIAAQLFPHRWHRQGIAVVLGQQLGLLAGAHGFEVCIAQRVERARLRRLAERLELGARGLGPFPAINVVPVAFRGRQCRDTAGDCGRLGGAGLSGAAAVIISRQQQPRIRVVAAQLLRHRRQVIGAQRHAHRFTGQAVHGEAGGVAFGEPDNRVVQAAEGVAGGFHLPARQHAFIPVGVNQLHVDHLAPGIVQWQQQVAGVEGYSANAQRLAVQGQGVHLRPALGAQVGVAAFALSGGHQSLCLSRGLVLGLGFVLW
ncbi:Uncharacterised protein [Serratia marcescens]|nr:Uncharacterised protein [Serratia marcescens]CVE00033.1 Uncharacterised protein [Serratia marcescens]CVF00199.1 Uncharacterised protein [Serratia marcescens]CVH26850.1 Uncharacterised protein [Serratia marcescens]CVH63858.1 Uncharacterised protein [Serratia marcescens]